MAPYILVYNLYQSPIVGVHNTISNIGRDSRY